MRNRWIVAVPAALIALGAASSAALAAAPPGPLSHAGRWLTDPTGRVVLLHGVNMVYKRPPYHPSAYGFDREDAAFLEREGFNTVRVGLIYKAVEPEPGRYDEVYLEKVATTVRTLADYGIYSQLDFHQDLYNERFGGEGFPDWAVQDDGFPNPLDLGFPGNYLQPGTSRAFDNFWANAPGPGGIGLQDRYAAAWRHVARRFRDEPGVMGYDLLNEPWPGTDYPTCANPLGCPAFDTGKLTPFSQRVIKAIREVDRENLVWYEPNVIFNFGADSSHADTGDPRAGFSFHIYCLTAGGVSASTPDPAQPVTCNNLENVVFQNAEKQSEETGDTLLLSEFGATDDLGLLKRMVDRSDSYLVSWQYWHYCGCDDPTTAGPGATQAVVIDPRKPPTGENVRAEKLAVLARPFARAVAGTPLRMSFDEYPLGLGIGTNAKLFDLRYSTSPPEGVLLREDALTEIAVPARHYPRGYSAVVTGAAIASGPGARVLQLANCTGAAEVSVRLAPSGATSSDCPLEAARALRSRLRLTASPRRIRAGRRTRIRFGATVLVAGRRRPVARARVRFAGRTARTDRRGRAFMRVTLRRTGRRRASATATGLRPGRVTLRVAGARRR